ncbi:unnamed protein product, partial [Ixodes persulcatus]
PSPSIQSEEERRLLHARGSVRTSDPAREADDALARSDLKGTLGRERTASLCIKPPILSIGAWHSDVTACSHPRIGGCRRLSMCLVCSFCMAKFFCQTPSPWKRSELPEALTRTLQSVCGRAGTINSAKKCEDL